jgi:hypothetical protein
MKLRLLLAGLAALAAFGASGQALASSECTGTITRLYTENSGYVWVQFAEGGAAEILADNPSKASFYAGLLAAKLAGRPVTFRYWKATSVCTQINSDVQGVWIN